MAWLQGGERTYPGRCTSTSPPVWAANVSATLWSEYILRGLLYWAWATMPSGSVAPYSGVVADVWCEPPDTGRTGAESPNEGTFIICWYLGKEPPGLQGKLLDQLAGLQGKEYCETLVSDSRDTDFPYSWFVWGFPIYCQYWGICALANVQWSVNVVTSWVYIAISKLFHKWSLFRFVWKNIILLTNIL